MDDGGLKVLLHLNYEYSNSCFFLERKPLDWSIQPTIVQYRLVMPKLVLAHITKCTHKARDSKYRAEKSQPCRDLNPSPRILAEDATRMANRPILDSKSVLLCLNGQGLLFLT